MDQLQSSSVQECILIVDFGSQYTQLIARRVRELSVYSLIVSWDAAALPVASDTIRGIILSGGPDSVIDEQSASMPDFVFSLSVPILAICYGMQSLVLHGGGKVISTGKKEYGKTSITVDSDSELFSKIPANTFEVWMSHGDTVVELPKTYNCIATTSSSVIAGIQHGEKPIFGLQFHPELSHTEYGTEILQTFLYQICRCNATWKISQLLDDKIQEIRKTVGDTHVLLGLSGGVDSSVLAVLLHRAIGRQLHPVFIDNGLLRHNEVAQVRDAVQDKMKIALEIIDARKVFYAALKGIVDPEQKRKQIGKTFISVFEEKAKQIDALHFLAQGTIYPDYIESAGTAGSSARLIKSHHNVGGLPEVLALSLLEPFRDLFKDEVRTLGENLNISREILYRHPFPGPGLGVRILGEITEEKVSILQKADSIFIEELHNEKLYDTVAQAFAVYLPVKSVGVVGDRRSYEDVIALRAVTTLDFMSATWAKLPYDFLARVSSRIISELDGISRVVYDISEKPPATIEWE